MKITKNIIQIGLWLASGWRSIPHASTPANIVTDQLTSVLIWKRVVIAEMMLSKLAILLSHTPPRLRQSNLVSTSPTAPVHE